MTLAGQRLAALSQWLDEDVRLARTVVERFCPVMGKYFNVTRFADLTVPTYEELAAMRQASNTAD